MKSIYKVMQVLESGRLRNIPKNPCFHSKIKANEHRIYLQPDFENKLIVRRITIIRSMT